MRESLALLLAAALTAPQAPPQPTPEQGVADGIRQVKEGDFEGAVLTLDSAARRLAGQAGRERLLLQAYVYLGVALVALDQLEAARQRFRAALAIDPALRLTTETFSPKVIAVFDQARKETPAGGRPGGGGSGLIFLGLGVGAAATALALRRGDDAAALPGFTNARFGARVVLCADGSVELPVDVSVLVEASAGQEVLLLRGATLDFTVAASPEVPSEVGFSSRRPITAITPISVAARSRGTVRLDTSLLCTNLTGGPARHQEWTARATLTTSAGVFSLQTSERLRVELP